jgi:hypothetical protein
LISSRPASTFFDHAKGKIGSRCPYQGFLPKRSKHHISGSRTHIEQPFAGGQVGSFNDATAPPGIKAERDHPVQHIVVTGEPIKHVLYFLSFSGFPPLFQVILSPSFAFAPSPDLRGIYILFVLACTADF